MIEFLNMRFAPTLSEETNVLVAKSATTEKYKIAKIYQRPIACVKVDWLLDSAAKGEAMPIETYEITDIFYGVEVELLELSHAKTNRVKRQL